MWGLTMLSKKHEHINNLLIYLHHERFGHWSDYNYRKSFKSDKDYWTAVIKDMIGYIGVKRVSDITQDHIQKILDEKEHPEFASRSAYWCYLKDKKHKFKKGDTMVKKKTQKDDFGDIRNKGIGGSDIGAIMGVNQYSSPLQVWMDKTGRGEKFKGNDATRWGHLKEPLILAEICKKHGLDFSDMTPELAEKMGYEYKDYPDETKGIHLASIIHHRIPFFRVNIDGVGFIPGKKNEKPILLEAKTTREYNAGQWENNAIPDSYYYQLQWCLFVLGWDKAIIGCLIGSSDFVTREVKADKELQKRMVQTAYKFWTEYVMKDVEPPASGPDSKKINELYPEVKNEGYIEIDDMEHNVELLKNIKDEIKQLENTKKEIENILKQQVGEYEAGKAGKYKVSWKVQERPYVDYDAVAAELNMTVPELKEKYKVVNSFRVLRTSKWK